MGMNESCGFNHPYVPQNMGDGFGFQLHFLRQSNRKILRIDAPRKPVNQDAFVVNGYLNPMLACSSLTDCGQKTIIWPERVQSIQLS